MRGKETSRWRWVVLLRSYTSTADLAGVWGEQLAADGAGREQLAVEDPGREHQEAKRDGGEQLAAEGAGREQLAAKDARRERPRLARVRLRGPAHAPLRPWQLFREAQAAMELLRLMALAMLASQPAVAGGAETVGNSSVGKVGGASFLQPKVLFHFLQGRDPPRGLVPSKRGGEFSRTSRTRSETCLQKETPFDKEDLTVNLLI